MPRKPFEEEPYEPVKADLLQSVVGIGRIDPAAANTAGPRVRPTTGEATFPAITETRTALSPATLRQPLPLPLQAPAERVSTQRNALDQRVDGPAELQQPLSESTEEDKPTKRFQVTADEDYELREFIHRLQRRSGSKVSLSTITRATLTIAMRAEQELNAEIDKIRPLPQPSNNDPEALARFEERWGTMLASAFRKARPMW